MKNETPDPVKAVSLADAYSKVRIKLNNYSGPLEFEMYAKDHANSTILYKFWPRGDPKQIVFVKI